MVMWNKLTFPFRCWTWPLTGLYGKLPGQGLELHFSVSSLAPGHSNPPLAGKGLVQVLERLRLPPPHVTPQEPQSLHSLHEPLTKKENMKWSLHVLEDRVTKFVCCCQSVRKIFVNLSRSDSYITFSLRFQKTIGLKKNICRQRTLLKPYINGFIALLITNRPRLDVFFPTGPSPAFGR